MQTPPPRHTYIMHTCIKKHRLMHMYTKAHKFTITHAYVHTHKSLTCMRTHSHMHACLFTATPRLVCGVFEDRVDSMKRPTNMQTWPEIYWSYHTHVQTQTYTVLSLSHTHMWIHKADTNNCIYFMNCRAV